MNDGRAVLFTVAELLVNSLRENIIFITNVIIIWNNHPRYGTKYTVNSQIP